MRGIFFRESISLITKQHICSLIFQINIYLIFSKVSKVYLTRNTWHEMPLSHNCVVMHNHIICKTKIIQLLYNNICLTSNHLFVVFFVLRQTHLRQCNSKIFSITKFSWHNILKVELKIESASLLDHYLNTSNWNEIVIELFK